MTTGFKQKIKKFLLKHAPGLFLPISNTYRQRSPAVGREHILDLFGTGKKGAEIGVLYGDFSSAIVERAKPSRLYLIDPWMLSDSAEGGLYSSHAGVTQEDIDLRYNLVRYRFRNESSVKIIRDFSSPAFESLEADSLDWVYIDGDHRYEAVIDDLNHAFRVVKNGGVITGDDYGEGGWWDGGVKRAVDGFSEKEGFELLFIKSKQFAFRVHK